MIPVFDAPVNAEIEVFNTSNTPHPPTPTIDPDRLALCIADALFILHKRRYTVRVVSLANGQQPGEVQHAD